MAGVQSFLIILKGGGGRGRGGEDLKCYECGEPGHFARECRQRGVGSLGVGSGRRQSPSPRRRGSPSYGYGRRTHVVHARERSSRPGPYYNFPSPSRGRKYCRSPPYRLACCESPYVNGLRIEA